MADEFAEFELLSGPEQSGVDEFAEFEQIETPGVEQPAADTMDSLAQRIAAMGPKFAAERERIQQQLNDRLAAADQSGKRLSRVQGQTAVARPALQTLTNLADGVPIIALPRLLGNAGIQGINNLAGTNIPQIPEITPPVLAPQNDDERLLSTIARNVGGVVGGLGVGSALSRLGGAGSTAGNVGRVLAANPALQGVGAVTGGVASEVAREAGAGVVGQTVAGLAGGIAPSLVTGAAQATVRGAFRGGEQGRQQVGRNVQTFERAGTTPSVGQATENRVSRAAETMLSRVPGGAGSLAKKADTQAGELATRIEANASRLAGNTSAELTGRKISKAITGTGGFVERSKATQGALYDKLDQQIPAATPTGVTNTQSALKELTKVDPGAARTTASLVNPKIKQIADDLAADAVGGTVPYSTVKALRTRIGEQLDEGLLADMPQKQLKRLYAALSQDLGEAATAAGPAARAAWQRANNYTRARIGRLEVLDNVVQKAGGGEAIYKAATSGLADGATKLRAVMRSLDEEGQKAVSATVLRRLGRSINSQQDELGEKFSTETFLTNWNKLSNEAKSTLFDRFGGQYSRDINALSKVAANLREGSAVFRNPSGTSQGAAQIATASAGAAALTSLFTSGNVVPGLGVAGSVLGNYGAARLMTNPRFVRWLAVSTKLPKSALTSQINGLSQVASRNDDDELREAVDFLKKSTEEQVDTAKNQGKNNDRP